MRNLYNVIDEMLEVIPEEENHIRWELTKIKESLLFSAPEAQVFYWDRCAEILNYNITKMDCEWKKQIQQIFAGVN